MHIAIIGSRGIPNHYGGFEQFAEFLAVDLVKRGNKVVVYNSHYHLFKESTYKGVEIVRCYDPEEYLGLAGQFIYDFNCIRSIGKRNFDIILQLGYTTNSIWGWMLPRKPVLIINMDGVEWMRSKYPRPIQWFLKKAERWAVNTNDYLIADSIGIQQHLSKYYEKPSIYIPYGAFIFNEPDECYLSEYNLTPYRYNMLVARLQSDNSIDTILEGVAKAKNNDTFLVVGNHNVKYGKYLVDKYIVYSNIKFIGGIYDQRKLNNLRYFSNIYFHGHKVGGTNPSLLEAMGSNALICAYDNIFNKAILGQDAFYFTTSDTVTKTIDERLKIQHEIMLINNRQKVNEIYLWPKIIERYEVFFSKVLRKKVI